MNRTAGFFAAAILVVVAVVVTLLVVQYGLCVNGKCLINPSQRSVEVAVPLKGVVLPPDSDRPNPNQEVVDGIGPRFLKLMEITETNATSTSNLLKAYNENAKLDNAQQQQIDQLRKEIADLATRQGIKLSAEEIDRRLEEYFRQHPIKVPVSALPPATPNVAGGTTNTSSVAKRQDRLVNRSDLPLIPMTPIPVAKVVAVVPIVTPEPAAEKVNGISDGLDARLDAIAQECGEEDGFDSKRVDVTIQLSEPYDEFVRWLSVTCHVERIWLEPDPNYPPPPIQTAEVDTQALCEGSGGTAYTAEEWNTAGLRPELEPGQFRCQY